MRPDLAGTLGDDTFAAEATPAGEAGHEAGRAARCAQRRCAAPPRRVRGPLPGWRARRPRGRGPGASRRARGDVGQSGRRGREGSHAPARSGRGRERRRSHRPSLPGCREGRALSPRQGAGSRGARPLRTQHGRAAPRHAPALGRAARAALAPRAHGRRDRPHPLRAPGKRRGDRAASRGRRERSAWPTRSRSTPRGRRHGTRSATFSTGAGRTGRRSPGRARRRPGIAFWICWG